MIEDCAEPFLRCIRVDKFLLEVEVCEDRGVDQHTDQPFQDALVISIPLNGCLGRKLWTLGLAVTWKELRCGGLNLEQPIRWFRYFSKVLYVGAVITQEAENLSEVTN